MNLNFIKNRKLLIGPIIGIGAFLTYIYINPNINNLKANEYPDSYSDNATLTINMAEIPQVPWNTEKAAVHVAETFTAAVHGSLAPIHGHGSNDNSNQNTLLENFSCIEELTCQAKLKKGIYFHNNREVNAYDIEFSLTKQLIAQKGANYAEAILDDIVGINNVNRENIKIVKEGNNEYPSGAVEGIVVKNKYLIEFKLKRKNDYFFYRISDGKIPIVPIEEFEPNYVDWKKYPVGFGKYKVTDADLEKYVFHLEKADLNEKIPKKIELMFSSDKVGDIKMLLGGPNRGNEEYEHRLVFSNVYSNGGFLYNYQTELGQNENFRKAISVALDRNKIARASFFNELTPEDQLIPNSAYFKEFRANRPIQQQNIAEAKRLLNLVPHHLWKNKLFQVPTYWEDVVEINTLPYITEIKSQLAEIGIHTNFLNTNINYEKFKDNDPYVLWLTGFGFANSDPIKNFAYFRKGSYFKNEHPYDPEYEELYQKSANNLSIDPKATQILSEYFTQKNIMTVILNQRMSLSYDPRKVISLGSQYNGIRFAIWEIKIRN